MKCLNNLLDENVWHDHSSTHLTLQNICPYDAHFGEVYDTLNLCNISCLNMFISSKFRKHHQYLHVDIHDFAFSLPYILAFPFLVEGGAWLKHYIKYHILFHFIIYFISQFFLCRMVNFFFNRFWVFSIFKGCEASIFWSFYPLIPFSFVFILP